MIKCGIDLVDVHRIIEKSEKNDKFVKNLLTTKEQEYLSSKQQTSVKDGQIAGKYFTLAGFFAGKEAVLKALGIGLTKGIHFADIEIDHTEFGEPFIVLYGKIKEEFFAQCGKNISISISHDAMLATAIVLLEK